MENNIKKYGRIAKNKLVFMGVLLIAIGAIFGVGFNISRQSLPTGAEITNWGLSFQKLGECPVGNANSADLKKYNSFFVSPEDEKKIYITFDAGFENGNTDKILNALKKHGVSATFFLVGNYFETQPELVKTMVEQGHIIGNHTWSHPDMSKIENKESFQNELLKVEEKYKEITGQEMLKLYRPPQGKFCKKNLEMASEMGYTTVFWSLAYVDWLNDKQPTKQEAFAKLIPRIHNGAVVLLHSTSSTNGEILDELLTKWKEEGYSFGNIKELIN